MSKRAVYGVWEHFWETNDLIGLYWTHGEAEAKAKSGGVYTSIDYAGMERWEVEEHSISWPPPDDYEWQDPVLDREQEQMR